MWEEENKDQLILNLTREKAALGARLEITQNALTDERNKASGYAFLCFILATVVVGSFF